MLNTGLSGARCWANQMPDWAVVSGSRSWSVMRTTPLHGATAVRSVVTHGGDEALRPHVRPVGVDVVQAGLAGVPAVGGHPASGDLREGRPQRVLTLLVHQHKVFTVG